MGIEDGASYAPRRAHQLYALAKGALIDLDDEMTHVEQGLEALAKRYRKELGQTRLILVPRREKGTILPQSLFWAYLVEVEPNEGGTSRRIWRRIKGELTDHHIAEYAGDYRNRARYYEYDAERRALGAAHARLADARQRIRKILRQRFPRSAAPESMASLATEGAVRVMSPWVRELVVPVLHLIERIVFAEAELRQMAEDHRKQPAHPDLSLTFSHESRRTHPRSRWRHRRLGWLDCVTDHEMRTRWRFPKSVRRAVSKWELPRRSVLRHLATANGPYDDVYRHARSGRVDARKLLKRLGPARQSAPLPFDPPGPPEEGAAQTA